MDFPTAGEMGSLWGMGAVILNHSYLPEAQVWKVETPASKGMLLHTFDLFKKKKKKKDVYTYLWVRKDKSL